MITSWATDTVTVERAGQVVERGTTYQDWDAATRHEVHGCYVQSESGAEVLGGREAIQTLWTLFAPPDADIRDTDRVVHDGHTYQIVGSIQRPESPTGRLDLTRVALERWEG